MRRREFIALLGATTLAADLANSQTSSKVYRVGLLGGGPPMTDDRGGRRFPAGNETSRLRARQEFSA